MSKGVKKNTVNRIIDANINRVKEGLRVCEEVARFILNSRSLTLELKKIRHEIDGLSACLAAKKDLLRERAVREDAGRLIHAHELKRESIKDIFFANMQRAKEATRVLEEFSKLNSCSFSLKFKELRYKIYAVEKRAAEKIPALCAH